MSMRSFLARLIVSRGWSAVATRVVSKSDPTPQTQEVSRARNFAARSCSARFPRRRKLRPRRRARMISRRGCASGQFPLPVFTAVSGSPAAAAMAMRPSVRPSVRCRSQHDVQRRGRCPINSISSSSWRSHGQRVGGAASVLCAATVASATERSEDNRRRQRVTRA